MKVSCQCGTITFPLRSPPLSVYHCHCTQCRKQSSSAFGTSVIVPASDVFPLSPFLSSNLGIWTRPANEGRTMDCYFCKTCGVRVMHRLREPDGRERDVVSLKGGCVEGLEWKGLPHIWTKSAVVEIPEGVRTWEMAPEGLP